MAIATTRRTALYVGEGDNQIAIGDVIIDSLVPSAGPGTVTVVFKGVAQEIVRNLALNDALLGISIISIPAQERHEPPI